MQTYSRYKTIHINNLQKAIYIYTHHVQVCLVLVLVKIFWLKSAGKSQDKTARSASFPKLAHTHITSHDGVHERYEVSEEVKKRTEY